MPITAPIRRPPERPVPIPVWARNFRTIEGIPARNFDDAPDHQAPAEALFAFLKSHPREVSIPATHPAAKWLFYLKVDRRDDVDELVTSYLRHLAKLP